MQHRENELHRLPRFCGNLNSEVIIGVLFNVDQQLIILFQYDVGDVVIGEWQLCGDDVLQVKKAEHRMEACIVDDGDGLAHILYVYLTAINLKRVKAKGKVIREGNRQIIDLKSGEV